MKYTIRRSDQQANTPFFVWVSDARSALNIVKDLAEMGLKGIDVLDQDGKRYDLAELERLAAQARVQVATRLQRTEVPPVE